MTNVIDVADDVDDVRVFGVARRLCFDSVVVDVRFFSDGIMLFLFVERGGIEWRTVNVGMEFCNL